MDRRRRLDAVRVVSAESGASDGRRRAAGGAAISQRGPEHHRLVRSHTEERGAEERGGGIMRGHRATRRGFFGRRQGWRAALARLTAMAAGAAAVTGALVCGASAAMVDNAHR